MRGRQSGVGALTAKRAQRGAELSASHAVCLAGPIGNQKRKTFCRRRVERMWDTHGSGCWGHQRQARQPRPAAQHVQHRQHSRRLSFSYSKPHACARARGDTRVRLREYTRRAARWVRSRGSGHRASLCRSCHCAQPLGLPPPRVAVSPCARVPHQTHSCGASATTWTCEGSLGQVGRLRGAPTRLGVRHSFGRVAHRPLHPVRRRRRVHAARRLQHKLLRPLLQGGVSTLGSRFCARTLRPKTAAGC